MRITKTIQGNPCENGHTERYVSTGSCVVCHRAAQRKRDAANPEKKNARNKKWRDANPEYNKIWKAENSEHQKEYWASPRMKKKKTQLNKKWVEENRGLKNHHTALRRANIKQQTPPWADLEKIKAIYIACPEGYNVDHKHPISKGGLHVHYNLKAISAHDNRVKYNKL
jgi:hypothetical protein